MIIDGDGHLIEPADMWARNIDPAYRAQVRVPLAADGEAESVWIGDLCVAHLQLPASSPYGIGDGLYPGGIKQGGARRRSLKQAHPSGWDPAVRLQIHDAEGIDAAVLFPTFGLFLGSLLDANLAAAATDAVNRFTADYCAAAPRELYGVAVLPMCDPARAAELLRYWVKHHGFVAGSLRPNPSGPSQRLLSDPAWDPLWAAAQDLDVPICIHNVIRDDLPQAGYERAASWYLKHALVHPLEGMLAFGAMIEGLVFERFPKLRVGFMESGCGWVPGWIERMHEHVEYYAWMDAQPPQRDPRRIFMEQCFVGCESDDRMLPVVQRFYGEDKVVWSSDMPHTDSTLPGLAAEMFERDDLSDSQRDGAFRRAAVKSFNLDENAIATAVAKRRAAAVH